MNPKGLPTGEGDGHAERHRQAEEEQRADESGDAGVGPAVERVAVTPREQHVDGHRAGTDQGEHIALKRGWIGEIRAPDED